MRLTENALGAFDTLKKSCLKAPVLDFADFNKPFLMETDASKLGLGAVLSQKQTDGGYHLVAFRNWSLTVHECNYHLIKLEFLALKWVIVEHFQEYLLWKPFAVKTDNNPLTYIMTTTNLHATWHCQVESLVRFTFSIEYHRGWDSATTDSLSKVTLKLNAETVKSILDRITMGTRGRADAHDLAAAKANEDIHKQVQETAVQTRATHAHVNLHVTDWVAAQEEDPILKTAIE